MSKTFAAHIAAFRDKTRAQMQAVLAASVQDLIEEAQRPVPQGGRMPVDTGFLRNSLVSGLNGSPSGEGPESYVLVAAQMQPGDTANFAWTASYSLRIEYGFVGQDSLGRPFNQEGRRFVEGAALQWATIVERNVGKLK